MPRARRPEPAARPHRPRHGRPPRIGLALAGGGPLGAIWEVGALCALEEALPGVDFVGLDGYVGVSAGAFLAAGLANGLGPRELCAAFIGDGNALGDHIDPAAFLRPAWGEFAQRAARLPRLALGTAWQLATRQRSWLSAAEALGQALPTGLFSHAPLEAQMRRVLARPGRSNDFRTLKRRLVLVATDLDRGTAAPFGMPGWDDVPISVAVAASAALPGLYPPVPVNGHWYADGALKKTLHASVLLDLGLDVVLCLNPLVPFDARPADRASIPPLVEGGLPVVLAQTFRSLIHSRLELGLKGYEHSHPGTELLLFEPDHHDATLFLANTFGYRQRRALAEHAYQRTRADLWQRRVTLGRSLARHGLALDTRCLQDSARHLLPPAGVGAPATFPLKSGRALPMTL